VIHIPTDVFSKIELLAGPQDLGISDSPVEVFAQERLAFLAGLSRTLLGNSRARSHPEVVSFAYWCRQSNLSRLKATYSLKNKLQMGLGLTFHVSPSNVPVNFAFSLAFGLLSGNSCVVRVPSVDTPVVGIITEAISSELSQPHNKDLKRAVALIKYERNDEVTSFFMSIADGRIVWGGDETILKMRAFPSKPRSREISFSDRYSICIIDPDSILQMSKDELERFCKNLYNDIYLMDQAACSSPQLVVWVGDEVVVSRAQSMLWPMLANLAQEIYPMQHSASMNKYIQACQIAYENSNVHGILRNSNTLYRIELSLPDQNQDGFRGTCGLVHELIVPELDEISKIVNDLYQTVTIQGVHPSEIRDLITKYHLRGIDRVVPVGKALDIGLFWDGYDLVANLSRLIDL
jgi:hypothetical protein